MTLIYQAEDLSPQAPQTHAFVIGIGRYPHLRNIDSRLTELTSSVVSARAFANWLIQTPLNNPAAPLATVELLLSPINPAERDYELTDGGTVAIDAASWPNIRRVFDGWFQRCDRHADNVALFYFCGHGLQKETTLALLPENFGQNRSNEWADTINFTATYEGMRSTCKAQTQCYLIDACRQVDPNTLKTEAFGGQALCKGDALRKNNPSTLRIFATQIGDAAFGEANQISRLTGVLLQALKQGSGEDGRVKLGTLAQNVRRLMQSTNQALPTNKQQQVVPELVGDETRPIHFTGSSGDTSLPPRGEGIDTTSKAELPPEQQQFLRELLVQHEKNLRRLLKQKSVYGAGEEPLRLLNQIEAEEQAIKDIQQQLGQ